MDAPGDVGVEYGENPEPRPDIAKPRQPKKKSPAKKIAGKPAKGLLNKAGNWAKKQAAAMAVKAAALAGGWWAWIIVGILIIIAFIIALLAAYYIRGGAGKTIPQPAGKNDPNIAKIVAFTKQETGEKGSGNMKLNFLNQRDLEYLQSGQIDKRLLAALVYLAERHDHIRVSHIVSGYEDIKTNVESGSFHDKQFSNNISAHKDGLAADLDEIDYVKDKCDCGSKIPVKVEWQIIGQNPFSQTPDALNQIKSPDDFAKPAVKDALAKMGVTGLDQKDLIEKMKASVTLAKIDSVYDLIDPRVIAAFTEIGVNGIDNSDLQSGLKRLQALQQLYELNPHDINALKNPQVQSLMATIGVPVSDELIANIDKYQAIKVIESMTSLQDLQRPDVQSALQKLGVNTADPLFQDAVKKMGAATAISKWQGNFNDPTLLAGLSEFGLNADADTKFALQIIGSAQATFAGPSGQLNTDVFVIQTLEKLAIYTNNPDMQDAVKKYRAAYKLSNSQVNFASPDFVNALTDLGLNLSQDEKEAIAKYNQAQYILNYHGDYTDPQFIGLLGQFGIPLTDDTKEGISIYKASQTLAKAAHGEISLDSQVVKDALNTIKAATIDDDKAKSAIKVGEAKDINDPSIAADKDKIGLNKATYKDAVEKLHAVKTLTSIHEFSDLSDPTLQANLAAIGLKDPKYAATLQKIGGASALLSVHSLTDLQKPNVQAALKQIGLKNPAIYENLGKLGSLQTLLQVHDLKDLQSPAVQTALKNLGLKNPAVYQNIAKLGSINTLLTINSAWDLARPDVIDALGNLKLADANMQSQLKQIGSIQTLMNIKQPSDLLKYQTIKALDNLGIIKMNDQLFGQIGAIQTLLAVDSLQDLMNPSSILALNTLGIISLSNPVTVALMAVAFIDNLTGGKLLGGLLGDDCKANTACYKPAAQENVYKVTEELLQMPYDLGNKEKYRVTQLIIYSLDYIRSKDPSLETKLDKLYWSGRPKNVGLFTMPEAWQNVHIGY